MLNFKGPEANSNNDWVKCPSRKFGGMFYYYNTRTKLSVWNLNDLTVTKDVNFQQIPNVAFINREPLNPPNFFGNTPQIFGNQSINNPFKVNASTSMKPLLRPNRIVSKPNLWDSSSNQPKINPKQFITTGTQTSDFDEKDLNFQCSTPLRKPILREPKIFGKIKKDVSTDNAYSNDIFEHGFKAIINLTNCGSHSSGLTKISRTPSSATDVENSDDIIDINLQDLNIKDSNSIGTCTKDESGSSSNSLAVTDLRHIITGRRKSKTYHDLEIFANDKESVLDSFITGPFKDKICYSNEASKDSTNESVVQSKSNALNLAHLKDLAAPDQMTSPWYLVVDTNMLLLELDFITNLLNSNPDCKLRVPDIVQKQLRNLSVNKLTESSLIIAARRAIRYLTNNLAEAKINSQVSDRKEIEQSDVIDNVIDCCMQIKNTDHFLIVLSNNEILKKKLNLLGIDCYSNDKLKEIMENKPKSAIVQNNKNTTRKRAFESITMSNIDSKRMCIENLPKITTGTFINNKNNLFKDFLSGNDQSIHTSTFFKDKPIDNNCMKIVGGARKKVIENQSKKESTPTFDLTFKSLTEKYNSESLQQNPSMFNIANKVIENKLKLRMDEWLCRFVQVMEETLIQLLQGFSSVFTCPPSLTLQEAVAIVHKLHKNNETVKKYCNNFSSLLSALNDANGKFNKDLSPNKFMDIFASGYQLVELLLDLEKNDVGLDSGIKYLKELLDEINDPEVDNDIHDFDFDNDPTSYPEEVPNTTKKPASSDNKVSTSTENIIVQVTNEGKQKTTSVDKYFQHVSLTPIPKYHVNNNTEKNCKTIRSGTKNDNFEENMNKDAPLQHTTFINKESELPAVEEGEAVLDANVQVAFVFQKFFVEIDTTFASIENFIKKTKKRISTMDNNKKKQSGHNLSQIYVILLNIIKSLKQIMYRDRFEDENIRHLIAKVIPTQEINDDIIMDYSEKVMKYLDQAALLENSLNELLTCLKTGAMKIVKTINT